MSGFASHMGSMYSTPGGSRASSSSSSSSAAPTHLPAYPLLVTAEHVIAVHREPLWKTVSDAGWSLYLGDAAGFKECVTKIQREGTPQERVITIDACIAAYFRTVVMIDGTHYYFPALGDYPQQMSEAEFTKHSVITFELLRELLEPVLQDKDVCLMVCGQFFKHAMLNLCVSSQFLYIKPTTRPDWIVRLAKQALPLIPILLTFDELSKLMVDMSNNLKPGDLRTYEAPSEINGYDPPYNYVVKVDVPCFSIQHCLQIQNGNKPGVKELAAVWNHQATLAMLSRSQVGRDESSIVAAYVSGLGPSTEAWHKQGNSSDDEMKEEPPAMAKH
jgi:hypothetical protein